MPSLASYLTHDHEQCDQLFAAAENAVGEQDWLAASTRFDEFRLATLAHFLREEETLFPAFEAGTGMQGGPTFVMRQEHDQMRDVLLAMGLALHKEDAAGFLGLSETLLMLMRQHNLKEEQILYPMCDRALAGEAAELLARMAAQQA
jgi:iron-sulfur cluster repair protein YtfE (RIC family)